MQGLDGMGQGAVLVIFTDPSKAGSVWDDITFIHSLVNGSPTVILDILR